MSNLVLMNRYDIKEFKEHQNIYEFIEVVFVLKN